MRDPDRIYEMLELLGKLWLLVPDMRLGQLVTFLCRREDGSIRDIFVVEDDEVLANIREALDNLGA